MKMTADSIVAIVGMVSCFIVIIVGMGMRHEERMAKIKYGLPLDKNAEKEAKGVIDLTAQMPNKN